MGVRDDDKSRRLQGLHQRLKPGHFALADDDHKHGPIVPRVAALRIQLGQPAVELG
ncbi:hypothetical protein D3C73_1386780 [compost metagenome]